jgi:hypothetical protein
MATNRIVQIAALCVTLTSLLAVGLFAIPRAQEQRRQLQLGFAYKTDDTIPPSIAFASSMLGPLKGFMVNALWYRVEQLKQEGKFAEINELSRAITTLQPRFPEVWRFHAWNMAYNVSVQTFTKEERWDWVNKGIRLLREEGIRYNPRAVRLYRELSWIFFHKVGQYSDDAHWYYKSELCREWQEILGIMTQGRTATEVEAEMKKIVDAPETLDVLLTATPSVRDLLGKHIAPAGYAIDSGFEDARRKERERLLRSIGKILMYNDVARLDELPFDLRTQWYYDDALLPMLREPANRPAVDALLNYLRKSVITDTFRMEPAKMLAIMKLFGPVDFRAASTHSLYWAHIGIEMMGDRLNKDKVDRINTLRHRIHALQDLTDSGVLIFKPDTGEIDPQPDVRFIEAYETALNLAVAELREAEGGDDKAYEAGHENFLLKAFVLYYQEGDEVNAKKYRDRAMEKYGKLEHNQRSGRYLLPMDEAFKLEFIGLIENMESLRAFLLALNRRALNALAVNDNRGFGQAMKMAKSAYDNFMKSAYATTLTKQQRMGLVPESILANNVVLILQEPSLPERRSRIWRKLPLEIRQAAWDAVSARLKADATRAGYDAAKMFPEPDNMEAYRKAHPDPLPEVPMPTAPRPAQPPVPTGPVRPKGPLRE